MSDVALNYQPSQDDVDDHLVIRAPVTAGPHDVGVTFPARPWGVAGDGAAALRVALQLLPAPARSAGDLLGLDRRAVSAARRRRYAEPAERLCLPAAERGRRGRLRAGDPEEPDAPRLSPAGDERRPAGSLRSLWPDEGRRRIRSRHRDGAGSGPGQPGVPVPDRAGARGRRGWTAVPDQRPGARFAARVLPLEQHSGRRTARGRVGGAN